MSGSNFHLTLEPHPPSYYFRSQISYYFRSQISPETKKHVLCVSVCHGARLVFLNRFCAHSQTSEITKLSNRRFDRRYQVPHSDRRQFTLFSSHQLVFQGNSLFSYYSHADISLKFPHRISGGPANWLGSLFSYKSLALFSSRL